MSRAGAAALGTSPSGCQPLITTDVHWSLGAVAAIGCAHSGAFGAPVSTPASTPPPGPAIGAPLEQSRASGRDPSLSPIITNHHQPSPVIPSHPSRPTTQCCRFSASLRSFPPIQTRSVHP
ncbi:hypothetical protein RRF57_004690 [Xylaria bambusicola]|uniref:Uncharacterized protein n=1 Tax=Xylaria bambusicola TaxID=326684 RepID=A0AAN7UB24_9PEZI